MTTWIQKIYTNLQYSFQWYKYLFKKPSTDITRSQAYKCRKAGHPAGYKWYNLAGLEPDYHCRNCGDYLG